MENTDERIEQYIKSANIALGNMDLGTLQPFDQMQFQPLYAQQWVDKITMLLQRKEELGISPQEMAELWPGASSLRCQIYFLLMDLKAARAPREQRLRLFNFFMDMVEARAVEDTYGFESNILRDRAGVTQTLARIRPRQATPEMARLLGRLYNVAYNLGCGFFLDFYLDYAMEAEGPYDVSHVYGPGAIMVIKRMMFLRPQEIWPEARGIANDITIYSIYRNVKFKTDMISVHSVYEGDPINDLVDFALEVDGRMVYSKEEIAELTMALEKEAPAQWLKLTRMPFEEIKVKGLEIRCFGMRKLFEKVGMDWRPEPDMVAAVKGKPFADNSFWKIPESEKEREAYWRRMYDPREDFFPGG